MLFFAGSFAFSEKEAHYLVGFGLAGDLPANRFRSP
jgi:hypothetical protein